MIYKEDPTLTNVAMCFGWLDDLGWEVTDPETYAEYIVNADEMDYTDTEKYITRYRDCLSAMAKLGKDKVLKIIKSIAEASKMKKFDVFSD